MSRHLLAIPLMALLCTGLISCNESDDEEVEPINYTNTAITSFSLAKNDDVLRNLNTVFFSIDLVNAQVFNADSLPKGTDVSALAVEIGTSVLSRAEITYDDANGTPHSVDYMADKDVKINFANGPATLTVTSYDGSTTRTYTLKVNVHKMDADLLYWDNNAKAPLPTALASVDAAKAVDFKGRPVVLTTGNGGASLATATDMDLSQWECRTVTLPADADPATLTGGADALFIVAGHTLWSSPDGETWSSTDEPMDWIYGVYEGRVVGSVNNGDGSYSHVTWPGGKGAAVNADCPVGATSALISYSNDWMTAPIAVMAGGVKADGTLSGDTWGYDGQEWARINTSSIPPAKGVTLVPYFVYRTASSSWKVTKLSAFIAMGGMTGDGQLSRTVYVSTDNGVHWVKAADQLQLPEDMPSFAGAQGLVYSSTLHAGRSGSAWVPSDGSRLPEWMMAAASRSTTGVSPIEEWECPYIYLFGGSLEDGAVNDMMWRGVINRLTFKPLQ